jgi:hypothetical protein
MQSTILPLFPLAQPAEFLLQPHGDFENGIDDSCLTSAGLSGKNHHLAPGSTFDGLDLLFRQCDGKLILHPRNRLINVHPPD